MRPYAGMLKPCTLTLQVSVLDSSGNWRDIEGDDPLHQTLAAAGVHPTSTEALRFRLPSQGGPPAPRRRGQAGGRSRGARLLRRCVRVAALLVQAALVLEACGWVYSVVGRRRKRDGSEAGSGSGTDPADTLMAYLTGATGVCVWLQAVAAGGGCESGI